MITNICKRTMNLIYCYTNIIFMMIVYSESFEDYRCIEELKMIPDIVYTKYNLQVIQNPNKKFNQKILEPEYFYLSLYNPYYICYFNPEFGLHDNLKKNYEYTINNEKLSLIAVDKDQTYTGVFPKYWHKRPEFFELNQTIANIFTMYKLIYTFYDSDINFDGNLMKNKIENSVNVAINTDVLLDIKDIMMDKIEDPNPIDTVDPKFYQLNENESKLIITRKFDKITNYYIKKICLNKEHNNN
ncbi:uncharacterized protein LOC132923125 [Rhopalosiphum padi]|uniref:uncharacterized protein LOC132923125 n=1 Tax=Rhopalosiphum padi TaxID=40932 RepID=UPI00298D910A|nr:uncharacterized protein LOC132923125 [Rhopalosiphum padi]